MKNYKLEIEFQFDYRTIISPMIAITFDKNNCDREDSICEIAIGLFCLTIIIKL